MTEEDNLLIALLGGAGLLIATFLGMNAQKSTQASAGFTMPAPPKAKTGCGCNAGK